ncbi:hypothetical protein SAMN05421833_13834 [Microbispora rosea]|uniref:Uncharacterized protein n=2 Tax=Microbispora rosea TaxID=58117 RepID=A0A1N7H7E0_9ACTN|nr:hypothetical protein SAMN05421833_13834 [Microbispora rosea]
MFNSYKDDNLGQDTVARCTASIVPRQMIRSWRPSSGWPMRFRNAIESGERLAPDAAALFAEIASTLTGRTIKRVVADDG